MGKEAPNKAPLDEAKTLGAEHLVSAGELKRFSALPEKLREDIFEDIKKRHLARESFDSICGRTKILIAEGEELMRLGETNSDRNYHPVNLEEQKLKNEEKEAVEDIDGLIQKLQKLAGEKDDQGERGAIH